MIGTWLSLYSGPRKLDHQLSYSGEPGKGTSCHASVSTTRRPSRPRSPWPPSRATGPSTNWPDSSASTPPSSTAGRSNSSPAPRPSSAAAHGPPRPTRRHARPSWGGGCGATSDSTTRSVRTSRWGTGRRRRSTAAGFGLVEGGILFRPAVPQPVVRGLRGEKECPASGPQGPGSEEASEGVGNGGHFLV